MDKKNFTQHCRKINQKKHLTKKSHLTKETTQNLTEGAEEGIDIQLSDGVFYP